MNAIKNYNISTEKSKYTLIQNPGTKAKFLTSPNLTTDSVAIGGKIQYTWQANQVAAIVTEPYAVDITNLGSWVKVSPTVFEYDNSKGNFDNWKNFGKWINNLNENANTLPPATKAQVQNLIKDTKTIKEKINVLYNYLQQNTRYVSVQLGIGGFKPIVAEKVAQVNYGDCKALSNYMKALLNEAGISANLIVIGNGMPSLNPNYASIGQANHMILAVPLQSDTTFLECTSQYHPMGFIGYDNADRNVLMITAEGGKVIKTPKYSSKDNYQVRKTKINFDANGIANIHIKSEYGYAQYEANLGQLLSNTIEQKKAIIESNHLPEAELISFKYEQPNKSLPVMTEELIFKSGQLFSKGGDKTFLMVNTINRKESVPQKVESRKTPFSISFDYQDEDEIIYTLPAGYMVEFIPKDITINSEFGSYSAKFQTKGNQIIYVRTQVMNSKKFPPEKYNDFVEFNKKIFQADKLKAILTKAP